LSRTDLSPAAVESIDRTVAETTVGPGESTTVTVTVELTEAPDLAPGDLVEIEDSFSSGFEAVTHQMGLPQTGGAGGSADGEEYLAVWNEGATTYEVTYEVTLPLDASGSDSFDITGTVDLAGQVEQLPNESITVGMPEDTGVALLPGELTAPSNDQVVLELLVTGADAGIGSYSVSLSADDTDVGAFADISLTNAAATDNSQITDGGASALVDAELSNDHAAEPSIAIAELTLDTGDDGTVALSADSASVADQSDSDYQIATTAGSTVTIKTGPPPLPGFDSEPRDLDGDSRFEDIDGDGQFDIFDVQALFNELDSNVVQNNPEAFNFNDDEDPDEVSIFDVQGLFNELE